MAGSRPNLHTMVPRWACIQGELKVEVKGHVIRTLLWLHENCFSQADGWIATTCTRWFPARPASRMCSRSRSRSSAIAHMVKQFVKLFAIQYGLTFCHYMRSLYEAPLHCPSSISIRQLDLMCKSWNELLRYWRFSFLLQLGLKWLKMHLLKKSLKQTAI